MAAANHPLKQARVLIVDDQPSAREGLRMLLHEQGFVVECANDGQSALEQANRFDPDVVLTDLCMPRRDGIQLCEGLRELDPTLPVILMTAQQDEQSILRGLRAGVDDYLIKPLDLDLVLWALRRAIDKRAAHIEQQRIRRHNELLLEQSRLAVKSSEEILAVVAHDLRSPLGVIQLTTQLLLDRGTEVSGTARKLMEAIVRSVTRSSLIIENLLDEAQLHGGRMTLDRREHRVEDLLEDARDLRPLALQREIALHVLAAPTEHVLACDRPKIGQVLSNLVGNAIKFSPRGSTVTVSSQQIDGGFRLAVQDQGPGITADAKQHLFERFWRQSGSSAPGVGLGLYIAKGIVDAHGGRIWVVSDEGAGSTFFVFIPAQQRAEAIATAEQQARC